MSYVLIRRVLAGTFQVPITKDRYDALGAAWKNLRLFANLEEEWEAVVQNYLELEHELLECAMRNMVVYDLDYFKFQDLRLRFAVRLSNLLSTAKSYLDHGAHHLNSIDPKSKYGNEFKQYSSAEYDKRFGYRFMEALRNYAQHRGLPIHGTSFDSSWVQGGEDGLLRYSVATRINLKRLREDSKFKKSIIAVCSDEFLDTEPLVRDYVEGLAAVHVRTRNLLKGELNKWSATVREALNDFSQADGAPDSIVGLDAARLSPDGTVAERVPLFEDLILMIDRLQRRNGALVNLARRFVTSQPKEPKKRSGTVAPTV